MAAIIAMGAGCHHPDCTGRGNIFRNGTILGLTIEAIRRQFDGMVAFRGLERFIDSPLQHDSGGMSLCLSFSVAAHPLCGILAVDEVLAVGDERFAGKCRERMSRLPDERTTIVLAGHNRPMVISFRARAVQFGRRTETGGEAEATVYRHREQPGRERALASRGGSPNGHA
jgi:lipopolysaccharide transport system ATP-binding protein